MDYRAIARNLLQTAQNDPQEAQRLHVDWVYSHSTQQGLKLLYAIGQESEVLRKKTYIYMLTFTLDPKKHPNPDADKIEEFIESQARRSALEIFDAYYVREHHADGRPHWHMCVKTRKPLRSDAFKHYTKHYGRSEISRTHIQDDSEIAAYLTKEGIPKKIQIVGS